MWASGPNPKLDRRRVLGSVSVQFHALPDELAPILVQAARELALHITAVRFRPEFRAEEIPIAELPHALADATVDRLAFTLEPPPESHSTLSFSDRNPGALIVDPGRLTDRGLAASWLTARASDPDRIAIWKRIAQRLRRMTRTGTERPIPTRAHGRRTAITAGRTGRSLSRSKASVSCPLRAERCSPSARWNRGHPRR